jgi:hypothetical protein
VVDLTIIVLWCFTVNADARPKRKINITGGTVKECIRQRYNTQYELIMWWWIASDSGSVLEITMLETFQQKTG